MRRFVCSCLFVLAGLPRVARADDAQTVTVRGKAPPRSASESSKGQDVIKAAPHRTGSDALSVLPGLWVSQHSGEGKAHQVFLRGFDAVHGQDVEFWVGGAPVNEVSNVHGQGYADLHFVPPELIRNLTLQPGSYDPRQGDFAVAGTVRYDLGLEQHGVLAKASAGSFGSRRVFVGWHPKETDANTFAAYEGYHTSGFGPARAATRHSALAGYGTTLGARGSMRVLATAYNTRYDSAGVVLRRDVERGVSNATTPPGPFDAFDSYDSKQGGDSTRVSLLTEFERRTDDDALRVTPYVVLRALRLRSNFTGFLLDPIAGDNTEQQNDSVTVGATAAYSRHVKVFSPHDRFEVGTQLRHDRIDQTQRRLAQVDDSVTRQEIDAKVLASDIAAYGDVRLRPWSRLELRGGLRADGLFFSAEDRLGAGGPVRSSAGSVLSPRATLDLRIVSELHALVSYGEGFRSPQARALAPGQSLPYTRVRSFEVGARYSDRLLSANLAGFSSWLSNDLVFDPVNARNEAVPGTRRVGVSADLLLRLTEFVLLSSSATYTQAVFRQDAAFSGAALSAVRAGDLLPYAPQLVARTDLALEHHLATVFAAPLRGHLGSGLTLLARRPLPFGEMGRDIFLWDARAELEYRKVTLGIDAMNLLDNRYFDGEFVYASRFSAQGGQSLVPQRHVTLGPPRALYATLTVQI